MVFLPFYCYLPEINLSPPVAAYRNAKYQIGAWYSKTAVLTTSSILSTKLATEFGDTTGKVKALATLNQLYRRGLIKKKTFATVDRGNVAIFFPRSWHESELSLLTYKMKN